MGRGPGITDADDQWWRRISLQGRRRPALLAVLLGVVALATVALVLGLAVRFVVR